MDNFCTGTAANVEHLVEQPHFRLLRRDVIEYVHVPGPVYTVLHFASPASPIDYLQLPIETMKVGSMPGSRASRAVTSPVQPGHLDGHGVDHTQQNLDLQRVDGAEPPGQRGLSLN